jgi:hypothetical protein
LWLEPESLYIEVYPAGQVLLDNREEVLHQGIVTSLVGYAYAQAKRMEQMQMSGYMGEKRKALFHKYGYDIKNAAHCVRLLHIGILLLQEGKLYVKLPEHLLEEVMAIKRGAVKVGEATRLIFDLFDKLKDLEKNAPLPPAPSRKFWDTLCYDVLTTHLSG